MVSVCLPSDALLQHLPSYLGFSYLGRGVSLHSYSSKAQPLLLTLEEGYLLTAAPLDLECGVAPLGAPAPAQPPLLVLLLPTAIPGLQRGLAPPCPCHWPQVREALQGHSPCPGARSGFSQPPLTSDAGCLLLAATDLRRGVGPVSHRPWPQMWGSSSQPLPLTSGMGCLLPAATDLGRRVAPLGSHP